MTPEELMEIVAKLPDDEREAYKMDLRLYGNGFIKKVDGRYRRVAPQDVVLTEH